MANLQGSLLTSLKSHLSHPPLQLTGNRPTNLGKPTTLYSVSSFQSASSSVPRVWKFEADPLSELAKRARSTTLRSTPSIQRRQESSPRVWQFEAEPVPLPMPYNNTAIPPSDEVTGSAALPREITHCF